MVVSTTGTATVTAFAIVNKHWTWPNAIVGSVLLLSGLLYLLDRLGIGPSAKSRVRDWLDDSGYSITTIQDDNQFHFALRDNAGYTTNIYQRHSDQPVTIAMRALVPTPDQRATFEAFTPKAKDEFWKRIRLELIRFRAGYSDLTLDGIAVSEQLAMSSSLTGVEFLNRVMFVRFAGRLYLELLADLLTPALIEFSPNPPKQLSPLT